MALTPEEQRELEQLLAEEKATGSEVGGIKGAMIRGRQNVEQRIKERGSESFGEAIQGFKEADSGFKKFLSGLNLVAMPFQRFEASIANAALDLQDVKGRNPLDGFMEGIKGERLGEMGDLFRKAGAPNSVAATIGLVTMSLPILKLLKGAKIKLLKLTGLSKFTDDGLRIAGQQLVKGSDDAVKFIGKNVDNVYAPINKVGVETMDVVKVFDDAPDTLVKHVEKNLGKNIEQISTIEDVRKANQIVGKLKPHSFGKETRGLAETLEAAKINKTYAGLKNVTKEALDSQGLGKYSDDILKAEELFTRTKRAADFIKKSSVDSTLLQPTKAGKVAYGIKKGGDLTTRTAINQLMKGGKVAEQTMIEAIHHLDKYNRAVAISRTGGKILNYTILGGVAGSIGARSASQTFDFGE